LFLEFLSFLNPIGCLNICNFDANKQYKKYKNGFFVFGGVWLIGFNAQE
jgi:hypothetical protein